MMMSQHLGPIALLALLLVATPAAAGEAARAPDRLCAPAAGWGEVEAAARATMGDGTPGLSVAVACGGRVVFAQGYGLADVEAGRPVRADTVFRLASTTKPMTAAVIVKLAEEGRLSLDDRLSKYLPDFPGAGSITLYQLLTQTSGLSDFTGDPSMETESRREHTAAEMIAWIKRLTPPTQFAPGQGWAYSNSGYVLLGVVIQQVTGQTLEQAYAQRVFRPAGADSLAFDFKGAPAVVDRARGYKRDKAAPGGFAPTFDTPMSVPGAAGAARGTARDLASFGAALLADRLVSSQGVAAMTAPGKLADGRPNRWGMPEAWREGLQADYGFGFFIDDVTGRRRAWHTGDIDGFHTWIAVFPGLPGVEDDVVIVVLRNSESGDPKEGDIQAAVFQSLGR